MKLIGSWQLYRGVREKQVGYYAGQRISNYCWSYSVSGVVVRSREAPAKTIS